MNKACPKDSYPLPKIDQLVDSISRFESMSFLDAYSGYNQIEIIKGIYCYKVMPFGLKNAEATYKRLVDIMFSKLIGKIVEAYIDDMVIKSRHALDHIKNTDEVF